jgi:hypothetical protein
MKILKGIGVVIVAWLLASLIVVCLDVVWLLAAGTGKDIPGQGGIVLILTVVLTVAYYRNKAKEEAKKLPEA